MPDSGMLARRGPQAPGTKTPHPHPPSGRPTPRSGERGAQPGVGGATRVRAAPGSHPRYSVVGSLTLDRGGRGGRPDPRPLRSAVPSTPWPACGLIGESAGKASVRHPQDRGADAGAGGSRRFHEAFCARGTGDPAQRWAWESGVARGRPIALQPPSGGSILIADGDWSQPAGGTSAAGRGRHGRGVDRSPETAWAPSIYIYGF
jgi:hypothetical protein